LITHSNNQYPKEDKWAVEQEGLDYPKNDKPGWSFNEGKNGLA
jgi:hypothetical protein